MYRIHRFKLYDGQDEMYKNSTYHASSATTQTNKTGKGKSAPAKIYVPNLSLMVLVFYSLPITI
jgi:hypothetical protein